MTTHGQSLTCAVLIDDGDGLPFQECNNVQDGPADGAVLWVQVNVEGVLIVHRRVLPTGLDVRHLQGVADGLNSTDRGGVRGSEDGHHT